MRELLLPSELGRLSYFLRVLPVNIFMLAVTSTLDTTDNFTRNEILLFPAVLIVGLYAIFFVYLPRMRDAGMPKWNLVFAFVPYLSSLFGLLLLFRPSKPFFVQRRIPEPAENPTVAGSTCSECGKRLVLDSDGVVTEPNTVVCTDCRAKVPS